MNMADNAFPVHRKPGAFRFPRSTKRIGHTGIRQLAASAASRRAAGAKEATIHLTPANHPKFSQNKTQNRKNHPKPKAAHSNSKDQLRT